MSGYYFFRHKYASHGWVQILEEYELLKPNQKLNKVIVMLTTSTSEFDIVRANINVEVNNYQIKPLTEDKVFEIINQVEKLGQ